MINYDFVELDSTRKSLALLDLFYKNIYQPNFTDPNGAASLDDIKYYLDRQTQGYGGKNTSHVILALDVNHIPVAGAIVDYIAKANSGVIEFLVVSEKNRNQGLGTSLFLHVEDLLTDDAKHIARRGINYILGDTKDPIKEPDAVPIIKIFDSWGFKYLDFPYVQPALSKGKEPVYDLVMLAKSYKEEDFTSISSAKVKLIVSEYIRVAMRLKPNQNREFLDMQGFLDERETVDVIPINNFLEIT